MRGRPRPSPPRTRRRWSRWSRRRWIALAAIAAALLAGTLYALRDKDEGRMIRRDDSRRFAHAEQLLRGEPQVGNVVYAPERGSWNVELAPGVTAAPGFARYLCTLLAGIGMVDARASVRTVDPVRLAEGGFDYAAATIEHVGCKATLAEMARAPR